MADEAAKRSGLAVLWVSWTVSLVGPALTQPPWYLQSFSPNQPVYAAQPALLEL